MDDEQVHTLGSDDDAASESLENEAGPVHPLEDVPNASVPVSDDLEAPTLGAVLAAMFEYTSRHRTTNAAQANMWGLMRAMMPTVDEGVAPHMRNIVY